MSFSEIKGLRTALHEYTKRSTAWALLIFVTDVCVYAAAVAGAVFFESVAVKLLCVVVASIEISRLFIIAHDAAHGSFTSSKWLNKLIGRIAFFPSLHNFSLWQIVHNRLHHRFTNLKGLNSWSPLSKAEYDALPPSRRLIERVYRTPLGLGIYYLVERWWKDKFFPTRRVVRKHRAVYWWDFALLLAYLTAFVFGLGYAGEVLSQRTALGTMFWGLVLPFAVWNSAIGFTVYLQHTNLRVPWFEDRVQWKKLLGQEDVTVHVRFPRWYGLASHDIMEHIAHHVNPKVPLYNLKKAQDALGRAVSDRLVSERFTPMHFLRTMVRCKLYDYEAHQWLDFNGRPTSKCTLPPYIQYTPSAQAVVRS